MEAQQLFGSLAQAIPRQTSRTGKVRVGCHHISRPSLYSLYQEQLTRHHLLLTVDASASTYRVPKIKVDTDLSWRRSTILQGKGKKKKPVCWWVKKKESFRVREEARAAEMRKKRPAGQQQPRESREEIRRGRSPESSQTTYCDVKENIPDLVILVLFSIMDFVM